MSGIRDAEHLAQAQAALDSGELVAEDAARVQRAIGEYNAKGAVQTTEESPDFLNWRPGMETEGPSSAAFEPAQQMGPPPVMPQDDNEALAMQELVDEGELGDAPAGLVDQIKRWWTGPEEEPQIETVKPDNAPEAKEDDFSMEEEPDFDEYGNPVVPESLSDPNVDEWRSSLSKDSRFYAPPASYSKGGTSVAMTNRVFYEPNVANVESVLEQSPELQKVVGYNPKEPLTESSSAYKKTADLMWRQKFLEAKKLDHNIVRYSQVKDELPGFMQGLGWLGENVVTPAMQAVTNADRTATGGIAGNLLAGAIGGPALQNQMKDLRESAHPGVAIPSAMAGAVTPGGLGARAAGLAAKAPGIAGGMASSSLLPRVLAGGGVGALASTGEGAVQDIGDAMLTDSPEMTPQQIAERRMYDAVFGSALGGAGQLLAEGAGSAMSALRRKHRGIPLIEEAGGRTAALGGSGFHVPPSMRARERLYDKNPLDNPGPMYQAADELKGPIESAARTRTGRVLETIRRENDEFFSTTRGSEEVAPTPLWEKGMELMRRGYQGGRKQPFAHSIPIQKSLARMTKGTLVRGAMANGKTVTQSEARSMFGDDFVDRLIDRRVREAERHMTGPLGTRGVSTSGDETLTPQARDVMGDNFIDSISRAKELEKVRSDARKSRVLIEPRKVNAQGLEKWIDDIQSDSKAWKDSKHGDVPAQMFDELHASALESRKVISPKWAETKKRHADMVGGNKQLLQEAGLPGEIGSAQKGEEGFKALTPDQVKQLENSLLGAYDTPGANRTATRALKALAADKGMVKQLLELGAHREVANLRAQSMGSGGGMTTSGGRLNSYISVPSVWNAVRKRSDPAMREFVKSWRDGAGMGITTGLTGRDAEDAEDAKALFIAMDMAKAIDQASKEKRQ